MNFRKFFLLFLILGLIPATPAICEDCLDYGTIIGDFPESTYGSVVNDVALAGNYAFLLEDGFLSVLDISDQLNPVNVLTYYTITGTKLELQGERLFLLKTWGFEILDCSDPLNLLSLGSYVAESAPRALEQEGDLVYLALYKRIEIVDASDVGNMTHVSYFGGLPDGVMDISVEGGIVLLAMHRYKYMEIDATDPANPVVLTDYYSCYDHDDINGITYYCYCDFVEVVEDLRIYTITDVSVDDYSGYTTVSTSLTVGGHRIGCGTNPVNDMVVDGNFVYLLMANTNRINVIDISDPSNLSMHGFVTGPDGSLTLDYQEGLLGISGDQLTLKTYNPETEIMDFSSHISDTPDSYFQAVAHGSDYSFGLKGGTGWNPVWGPFAYEVFNVYDMTVPGEPQYVNTLVDFDISFGPGNFGLELVGNRALLWDKNETSPVREVDVSDPLGSMASYFNYLKVNDKTVYLDDLAVLGDLVYTVHHNTLEIIDLSSDPVYLSAPQAIGGSDLQLAGDLMYSSSGNTIWAFDVSIPNDPVFLNKSTGIQVDRFLGAGENLVFCSEANDVFWFPASEDGSIAEMGRATLDYPALGGVVQDGTLYLNLQINDGESLMQVVDIQDPAAPVKLGNVRTDLCLSLTLNSDVLYPCNAGYLLPLPLQCPAEMSSVPDPGYSAGGYGSFQMGAVPNPFNPITEIRFNLDKSQAVKLAVFDLRGNRVAEIANGVFPAGENRVAWRGVDTEGRQVASGSYFARIESAGEVGLCKLLLVR